MSAAKQLPFQIFKFHPKSEARVNHGAIIVLQEWWGINDQIKLHAQNLADRTGAVAVVPDLYKGKIGVTAEEASHLMNELDWRQAMRELEELVKQLREAKYTKLGSIGFCMGGGLSLALATQLASTPHPLLAAVTCYGTPPKDLFDVREITKVTPVQGHFGDKDGFTGFSDSATADALEFNLKSAVGRKADVEIFRYPNLGHAFLNDEAWSVKMRKEIGMVDKSKDVINEERDERTTAWNRITNFFVTHFNPSLSEQVGPTTV
ncbi:dienelactone hydrolase [Umbelopsis sp. PMI_123]|nr:dienelactone hydrolase [Umbelopsis sp. PMI_123]